MYPGFMLRTCNRCGESKSESDFPRRSGDRLRSECKSCRNAYMRDYYQRPGVKEKQHARVARNPRRKEQRKKAHVKARFGISLAEYEDFRREHPETCPLCRKRPARAVDHDHTTGVLRGVLCDPCNLVLGLVEDDVDTLRRMFLYLSPDTPSST